MSEHSPGSWIASGNGVHSGAQCVATTHMEPREQRVADARLIAAAPDLLEALQVVRMSAGWSIMSDETRGLVIEALAKASA